MPNKELLIQYATNKLKISQLEKENDMLKEQVQREVEALIGPDAEQVALQDLPGISFSLAKARPKWQYSPTVQDVMIDLKEMQKVEEQTGKAINLNDGKKELRVNLPKDN